MIVALKNNCVAVGVLNECNQRMGFPIPFSSQSDFASYFVAVNLFLCMAIVMIVIQIVKKK